MLVGVMGGGREPELSLPGESSREAFPACRDACRRRTLLEGKKPDRNTAAPFIPRGSVFRAFQDWASTQVLPAAFQPHGSEGHIGGASWSPRKYISR